VRLLFFAVCGCSFLSGVAAAACLPLLLLLLLLLLLVQATTALTQLAPPRC
jgi:hypothetical protein